MNDHVGDRPGGGWVERFASASRERVPGTWARRRLGVVCLLSLLLGGLVAPPDRGLAQPARERSVHAQTLQLRGGSVLIEAGETRSLEAFVPRGGWLELRFEERSNGSLSLMLERDAAPPRTLLEADVGGSGRIAADLSPFAGRVLRIRLVAKKGRLRFSEANLRVPRRALARRPEPARHLVVVLADTLRGDRVRAIDPRTRVSSPAISALARRATTFTQAFSHANWTKPSVATALSGILPWQHGARTHRSALPESVSLLAERLSAAGFHTAGVITNGYISRRFGFDRGWDVLAHSIDTGRGRGDEVAEDVEALLARRPSGKRLFLYIHTTDIHAPYRPAPIFLRRFFRGAYRGIVDFDRHPDVLRRIRRGTLPPLAPRDRRRLEALYDAGVSHHDRHLARIFRALERAGIGHETSIVFLSDHGEELFDHGSTGHGGDRIFRALTHVPMIIRHPGLSTPRQVDAPVGLVDLVPTLLEVLGLPSDRELPGRSLLHLCRGDQVRSPRPVVSMAKGGNFALQLGGFELLRSVGADGGHRDRLFDRRRDPNEREDLASRMPITRAHLSRALEAELGRTGYQLGEGPSRRTQVDDATAAQLRALGYLDDDPDDR